MDKLFFSKPCKGFEKKVCPKIPRLSTEILIDKVGLSLVLHKIGVARPVSYSSPWLESNLCCIVLTKLFQDRKYTFNSKYFRSSSAISSQDAAPFIPCFLKPDNCNLLSDSCTKNKNKIGSFLVFIKLLIADFQYPYSFQVRNKSFSFCFSSNSHCLSVCFESYEINLQPEHFFVYD